MMKSLWVLLLCFPATVFAQSALDDWYGEWTSHYSGGDSGTCSVTISSSTATQAAVSASCVSSTNQMTYYASGQVALDGGLILTSGTVSNGAQFTGTLQGTSGSGQWVDPLTGTSGTWTMSKQSSQTTLIAASGRWNYAVYSPYCNYTEQGTVDFTYANGAYSIALYTSNSLGGNCQSIGAESCLAAGFASAQDLLTTSQFKAAMDFLVLACPHNDGSSGLQPVSFASPDSVSGTIIDNSYGSMYFQMIRTASAPTSYGLGITKSGAGSGSVSSSPSGIDCGVSCSASFSGGTVVSLIATAAPGSYFAGWSGACSGSDSCSVTMDAAKSITAIFKPTPFAATTTSVITETSATIVSTITFNTPDVGKQGAVFITSWAPVNGLSALGISAAALDSKMRVTATNDNPYLGGKVSTRQVDMATLAETDSSSFVLVQLTPSGWQLVVNGQLIPYTTGVLGDALASQSILSNTDPTSLKGAEFCLGYGTSAAEMIASGRMMPVADIPGATAATNGSCNVTDIVVEFYNTNLDHYFITADANEAAAIDNGSAGPGWSRTGNSFRSSGNTSVCRFYGSQSPGPNSHFYTADAGECAHIKQIQVSTPATEKRWNFESLDFVSVLPVGGTCSTGTQPVYRAYNNGFARGVDSNHRITGSLAGIQEVVARGWIDEGVVMCAPN